MKKFLIALVLVALAGLATSIVMTRIHYQMGGVGLDARSFCHVSDFFDCDSALASRYAKMGPFLNSELGILYYVLVLAGLLYSLLAGEAKDTLGFLFLSSIFAVAYSIFMAYISLVKLGVLCLLCTTNYVTSFLLFALFPKALGISYSQIPGYVAEYVQSVFGRGGMKTRLPLHLGGAIAVFVLGFVFFKGLNPEIHRAHAEVPKDQYLKYFRSQPTQSFDVSGRPMWGSPSGKVEIVEFSDFQCPFCRRAAFTLKPYLKEYQKDVKFYYFNYPLDSACNPAMDHSMHPVSCIAAKAALCAQKSGKFWEYHDLIFENQKRLSRSVLVDLAKEAGLETGDFEKCMASDEIAARLKEDVDQGGRVQIKGTPSVYINGRPFADWPDPDRLRLVIEAERK